MLFFDNLDVFSIVNQVQKKNALEKAQTEILLKLEDTEKTLKELKTLAGKERFAREKKFFKRDNEEIFVISYE
ncbi:MAG: cell division protein DivIC [Lentimonas sp.]|jgi:cell division protein DivIC